MATNLYGSAESICSVVFMGHFVGRESSPSTTMQVAMVMAAQLVMMYI